MEQLRTDVESSNSSLDNRASAVPGLMGKAMEMESPDAKQMKTLASLIDLIRQFRGPEKLELRRRSP